MPTIAGTNGNNFIFGTPVNDRILPGFGDDTINGGAGADLLDYSNLAGTFAVNLALGTVSARDAADIEYESTVVNIENVRGSFGADTITGDDNDNLLLGGGGNDWLDGRDGDNTLEGGAGDDTVIGGDDHDVMLGDGGNDSLNSEEGDDHILGGSGHDTLIGTTGQDTLDGGSDDDEIDGGDDTDSLIGGSGNDTVEGGEHEDTIHGGSGDDVLMGDTYDDEIYGGDGDDTVIGGIDVDTMQGGAGSDVFAFNIDFWSDFIVSATPWTTAATDIDRITDFEGAGVAGGDILSLDTNTGQGRFEVTAASGKTRVYAVYDDADSGRGNLLGHIAITSSGGALTAGDVVFTGGALVPADLVFAF